MELGRGRCRARQFSNHTLPYLSETLDPRTAWRSITQVREASGRLLQWQYEEGVLSASTEWSKSTREAYAFTENCVNHAVRSATGELSQWMSHPLGGGLSEYSKWSKCAEDGSKLVQDLTVVCVTSYLVRLIRFMG